MAPTPLTPLDKDEVEALHQLIADIEKSDEAPHTTALVEVQEWFDDMHFNPKDDLRVVRDDGRLIAWAACRHRPAGVRHERAHLVGGVRAEHRGQGIGRKLLQWSQNRAHGRLAGADPTLPQLHLVDAFESQDADRRLQARMGFEECRWFIDMKRPLGNEPEPQPPEGIEIVPWQDEHTAAVRLVSGTAFEDHWGSTPYDEATWNQAITGHGIRLDLSFVALDGDQIVAYSLNEVFPESDAPNERIAWVGSLGTLREYRKRGIASSLLAYSHARFAAEGFTHAMLDVDAESQSDAGALYMRNGYEAVYREVLSQKAYPAKE